MILNLSILFVLILLSINTVFVAITFIFANWLQLKDESFNYGIWHACTASSLKCHRWYDNGQTAVGYTLSGEPFQALSTS